MKASDLKIYVGKPEDYKRVKYLPYNRQTDPNHVKDMKAALATRGWVKPITLNKKWYLIDGQHTFKACQELEMTFPYIILDDTDAAIVIEINSLAKNWKMSDYLHYFVTLDNKPYVRFDKFIKSYNINISKGLAACLIREASDNKTPGGYDGRIFRFGEFTFDNYDRACQIVEYIIDWQNAHVDVDVWNQDFFFRSACKFVSHPAYKHSIMVKQLKTGLFKTIVRAADTVTYLKNFMSIYNRGVTESSDKLWLQV